MYPQKTWKKLTRRILEEESGILTFEYILIGTLLVIGIVGGLAVARDMIIFKMTDFAGAFGQLDQSCGFEAENGHDRCLYLSGTGVHEDGKTVVGFHE